MIKKLDHKIGKLKAKTDYLKRDKCLKWDEEGIFYEEQVKGSRMLMNWIFQQKKHKLLSLFILNLHYNQADLFTELSFNFRNMRLII